MGCTASGRWPAYHNDQAIADASHANDHNMAYLKTVHSFVALRSVLHFIVAGVATQSLTPIIAYQETLNLDWQWNCHVLELSDGILSGPGAEWLKQNSAGCQFVLFGEQHGVAGLPETVAGAYTLLQPDGFDYLIMERGPWIAEQLSNNGVLPTLQRFPHSVAFDYDGEVRLLKAVERQFDGHGDAFWGVDQSITAIHALERLSEILPTHASRRAAHGLFLKDALQTGRFLSHDNSRDLQRLRSMAGNDLNRECSLIIDALEKSMSIFVAYHTGQRAPNGIGISDIIREQYMIDQCDRYLAESASLSHPIPRAILKMGGAHVIPGIGPNGVVTLGDHLQHVAESNGLNALHIGIRRYSPDSAIPANVFASGQVHVLIDTRTLRNQLPAQSSDSGQAGLVEQLQRYDALILLKDAASDTSAELKDYESQFKHDLLVRVGILLMPLLALLSFLVPLARKAIRGRKTPGLLAPFFPWLLVASIGSVLLAIVIVQVLRIRRAAEPSGAGLTGGYLMTIAELCTFLVISTICLVAVRRDWWTPIQRIHFIVASIGVLTLAIFTHWWNLGRMLG